MHSSDQCKVCLPSDVMRSPRLSSPFWNTVSNQNLKPEKAWEPGCATCLLLTQPVAKTMLFVTFSDSYSCSNSCNLLLLMEYNFGHCIALYSQADQDQQRHSASSSANCAPWLASRANGRSAAELEEARVGCAGCLCTWVQEWLFHHQEESE